jgi:hypothetical protein
MSEVNVYAPPETDILKGGGAHGGDAALRQMSTKEVKKLFNHSNTIRALIFLWCLGLVGMAVGIPVLLFAGARGGNGSGVTLILGVIVLFFAAFQFACVYGCWNRLTWGRTVGIIVCAFALLSFPIGTIIGIFGILAFSNGARLFGEDRLTHAQLKAEVAYRKANDIR